MKFLDGQAPYIIAEIGANHNGDMAMARQLIDVAHGLGADCAKFQSWDVNIFSGKSYRDNYFLGDDYRDRKDYTLHQIVEAYAVSPEQLRDLRGYCREKGIDFASTPFETAQIDTLIELDAPFIKIASMDVTSDYLLRHAGATGKPIVLSTGMATLGEIEHAIRTLENEGNRDICVLHCIAIYPTPDRLMNLRNIETLRRAFGYPVGFSDHSRGPELSLAAIALGAVVIEKHFTLDKTMFGWDHGISMDPAEMKVLIEGARRVHVALGTAQRVVGVEEMEKRTAFRRSVIAARPIAKGMPIAAADLTYRRPGTGVAPNDAHLLIGRMALNDIPYNEFVRLEDTGPATQSVRKQV